MGLEHWFEQILPRFLGAPQLSPPDLDCTFPLNSGTSLPVTYEVQNTPPAWLLHPVVGLNQWKTRKSGLIEDKESGTRTDLGREHNNLQIKETSKWMLQVLSVLNILLMCLAAASCGGIWAQMLGNRNFTD